MAGLAKAIAPRPQAMSSRKLKGPHEKIINDLIAPSTEDDDDWMTDDMFDGSSTTVPEGAPRKVTLEILLGAVPPLEERIHEDQIEKRGIDGKYHVRNLILTQKALYLTIDNESVKDCIPLLEITEIKTPDTVHSMSLAFDMVMSDRQKLHLHFEICTRPNGYNSGMIYEMRAFKEDAHAVWMDSITKWRNKAVMRREKQVDLSQLVKIRKQLKALYDCDPIQMCVALLVFLNFIATAAQAELQPIPGSAIDTMFSNIDIVFTSLFTVELVINMMANWFTPFWVVYAQSIRGCIDSKCLTTDIAEQDGWNVFDFLVVSVSLIGLVVQNLPGVSTLRLMRAFRVMRLFGRLESLRCIINALTASIAPVCNAFLIMLLVTSIYAILGTSFFGSRSPDYFGTFSTSLFSMFQVITGDAWASDIARPLFTSNMDPGVVGFFGSFIVIVGWTLLQVVVAVLLENFGAAAHKEKEKAIAQRAVEAGHTVPHFCTDPLMATLAHFDTNQDLSKRIRVLFQALDTDDSKTLSYRELQNGLRKLKFKPRIHLSEDDFDVLTNGRSLCNAEGELSADEFERVMRKQLALYVQRQVANAMSLAPENDTHQIGTILFVLKLIKNGVNEIMDNAEIDVPRERLPGFSPSVPSRAPSSERRRQAPLEQMVLDLQKSMNLVLQKLQIDKEESPRDADCTGTNNANNSRPNGNGDHTSRRSILKGGDNGWISAGADTQRLQADESPMLRVLRQTCSGIAIDAMKMAGINTSRTIDSLRAGPGAAGAAAEGGGPAPPAGHAVTLDMAQAPEPSHRQLIEPAESLTRPNSIAAAGAAHGAAPPRGERLEDPDEVGGGLPHFDEWQRNRNTLDGGASARPGPLLARDDSDDLGDREVRDT